MVENTPFVLPVLIQKCWGFHLKPVLQVKQSFCDSRVLSGEEWCPRLWLMVKDVFESIK